MADVAIVIGHHPDAPGAALDVCGDVVHEYDFWKPFAHVLASMMAGRGYQAAVIERPHAQPDGALAERVNATGARAAIELHFNSFSDEDAHGTEMLYWGDSWPAKQLADLLRDGTTHALGTRNRGGKPVYHGYPFLRLTEMPAVICEPAFGSNEADARALLAGQDQLLGAYADALCDFLR